MDWDALEDIEETPESMEAVRAITGRGSALLGSMPVGEVGEEVPKVGEEGRMGAEMFRNGPCEATARVLLLICWGECAELKLPSCGLLAVELDANNASRRSLGDRGPSWREMGEKEGDNGE